jgi:ABC-type sugar transport system permease subunit
MMERTYQRYGYLFILPFFLTFAVFWLYPVISTFITSLTDEDFTQVGRSFVGLGNYLHEISNAGFWRSFLNTWIIWLPNIILQLSIALLLAVVLTNVQQRIRAAGVFRAIFFFPNLVTVASIAILAYAVLDWQNGVLNQMIFGTGPGAQDKYIFWLNSPVASRIIVSLIQTWMWFGYTMILFIAGIQSISASLFEAAIVDGAGPMRTFRSITLPLLRPVMIYVVITSLIGGLNIFDLPWIITRGRGGADQSLTTTVVYLSNRAFRFYQLGAGASVSYLLLIFTGAFSYVYLRFIGFGKED